MLQQRQQQIILYRHTIELMELNCITTRCTNNFGPNQFPEKLIPKTIIRSIKNLKDSIIW